MREIERKRESGSGRKIDASGCGCNAAKSVQIGLSDWIVCKEEMIKRREQPKKRMRNGRRGGGIMERTQ